MRKAILMAVVAAMACVGVAQGGGGGQGRGGMRMMFGGGGGINTRFALREDVSKELNLTADQRTKLQDVQDKMQEEMRAQFQGGGGPGNGGGPDRDAMRKMAEDMMAKQKAEITKILDEGQMKRLKELSIQRAGVSAITNPEVQTGLGLSDEQKAKIKELQDKQQEAMQTLFQKMRDGDLDRDAMRTSMENNRKIMDQELDKVLTADQKKKLTDMGGKPFTFDKDEGGPGGR